MRTRWRKKRVKRVAAAMSTTAVGANDKKGAISGRNNLYTEKVDGTGGAGADDGTFGGWKRFGVEGGGRELSDEGVGIGAERGLAVENPCGVGSGAVAWSCRVRPNVVLKEGVWKLLAPAPDEYDCERTRRRCHALAAGVAIAVSEYGERRCTS